MVNYDTLTDLNLLYDAFRKSKMGVDWKCSIQRYEANVLPEIMKLRRDLLNGKYKQKAFFEFDISERGKHRHIKSLHISDRVLQRALCDNVLIPIFYKKLIYDNGASVRGKGIEFTRERLVAHLQKYYRKHGNKGYVLLVDFSKFFDSIPHDKLMEMIRENISDERLIKLLEDIICTFDEGDKRSLGIGSQVSQIFGIYYPTRIDTYIKVVKGCKYYGRYMDDLYVIHEDKAFLKELLEDIKRLSDEMGLKVNIKKTQICRIDKGFRFLKLYHFVTNTGKIVRKPCKKNITRERRKLKRMHKNGVMFDDVLESYKSWRGNMLKYNSYKSIMSMDELFNWLYGEELYAERKDFKPKRSKKHNSTALQCVGRKGNSNKIQLHDSHR